MEIWFQSQISVSYVSWCRHHSAFQTKIKACLCIVRFVSHASFFWENMKTRAPCQLREDSRMRCARDKKHFRHSGLTLKTDCELINTHRSWGGVREALRLSWSGALWNIEKREVFVVDFDPSAAYLSFSSASAVASHQSWIFFLRTQLPPWIQIRTVCLIYANVAFAPTRVCALYSFIYQPALWSQPKPSKGAWFDPFMAMGICSVPAEHVLISLNRSLTMYATQLGNSGVVVHAWNKYLQIWQIISMSQDLELRFRSVLLVKSVL